jgi:ribonuclease BN (tRNA processing enzyme)
MHHTVLIPGGHNGTMPPALTVTFAGSGDAFGSGGRHQACIHLQPAEGSPVLLDCGATSLTALKQLGLNPAGIAAVFVSHLHGDHFAGLPFLILDAQFSRRTAPLAVVGPPGTAKRLADTMECLFPGSSTTARRFDVTVRELAPGADVTTCGTTARAWAADHPSGAPALILRLTLAGKTIAYTGDTAWTNAIASAAADADLLIAEAYYRNKDIPYHLRLADLEAHRDRLTPRRVIITHMSTDMLGSHSPPFEQASDGLIVGL